MNKAITDSSRLEILTLAMVSALSSPPVVQAQSRVAQLTLQLRLRLKWNEGGELERNTIDCRDCDGVPRSNS